MIDTNLLITDFDETLRRLVRKGVERETIEELRDLLVQRRTLTKTIDDKRAESNIGSKKVAQLAKAGEKESVEELKQFLSGLKEVIATLEEQLRELESKADYISLRIPNMPANDCPDGQGEDDNVVLRYNGYDASDFESKSYRSHWDVATDLGIFDAARAAKLSGAMFALLRGDGARLLRALVAFGIDLNRDKYEEILPPHFVTTETFTATGHLPKFEDDAYKLRDDDLWAIPTGEVPLMSLHRDEILEGDELPKRYMAYTVCFRREAGSAGKQTRGMQRVHEFHKVELLKLCRPDQVQAEFEEMLAEAERPLQLLGLPYRVVDLCTKDLTFSSSRIFDLEVYAPGVDRWLEVSSVGIFTDFQARRAQIRFRGEKGKPSFVHAINGSAMATPRMWAAVVEHGQQSDGSIRVPEALVPYMGSDVIRSSKHK